MSLITKKFAVAGTILLFAVAGQVQASCNPKVKPTNFEQFKECTYQEPDTGIWIVDGDVPITTEAGLRKFYEGLMASPTTPSALGRPSAELIVNRVNNADDVWSKATRCGIRYCVSQATAGARYQEVVNAMAAASNAWSGRVGVRLTHVVGQDGNCTAQNAQVEFDVQVVTNRPYLARAFFPTEQRARRNVYIDTSSFAVQPPLTLEGILRHELGHALGFRHEHTRPETGQCFEDNNWRPLTPYDSESVMHYPQCGGTAGWALNISNNDIAGAVLLYGNQTNCQGCIVNVDTNEKYCLPVGQRSGYSLPTFIYNKPVYVNASEGTGVMLCDWDNLSYNRIATFTGTVPHNELKNVKAKNGKFLDFSHPRSMRVVESSEPLGCIVSLDTQEKYCLPVGKRSEYSLPEFIYNKPVYVEASEGTAVMLCDWDNLSYNRLATFTGTVPHDELKRVKAKNGEFLDFSHPRSMRVIESSQ